jgi:hypothetical protein
MRAAVMRAARLGLAVLVVGTSLPLRAQTPTRDELMQRVAVSVQAFVDNFTNVVAQEEYHQRFRQAAPQRRLKSDFLLVGYPGQEKVFLTFRDVLEVDGRPVRDQQERVAKLFLDPFQDAVRRAGEIEREGLRHSVSNGRLMNPLQVMSYLQDAYQGNFTFTVRGVAAALGPGVREIDWEQDVPAGTTTNAMRGKVWVVEQTGRVVKTELRTGIGSAVRFTTTTFAFDPTLRIDVPVEMHDAVPGRTNDEFLGTARYANFRRFQVRTDQDIVVPPTPR